MLGVGVLEGGAMVAVEGGNNCNDAPIPPSVQPCTVRTGRLVGVFLLERSLVRMQHDEKRIYNGEALKDSS